MRLHYIDKQISHSFSVVMQFYEKVFVKVFSFCFVSFFVQDFVTLIMPVIQP